MSYVRTNYRVQGNVIHMASSTDLTGLGGLIPSGYLAYSTCCLLMYIGDRFLVMECSASSR